MKCTTTASFASVLIVQCMSFDRQKNEISRNLPFSVKTSVNHSIWHSSLLSKIQNKSHFIQLISTLGSCLHVNTSSEHITKTHLFKYIENFTTKNWKVSDKNSDICHISAQNIDCAYSLEPPQRGGSNEYPQSMFLDNNKKNNVYACKPQFYYIKVGFKGVRII